MIPTMTVKMALVLLLLCLAFVHFTFPSTRLRYFSFNETERNWTDSLTRCRQNNETPVTLYDEEDGMFTVNFTYGESVWLGLRKVRNITWSDGSPVTFNKSSVDVTNGKQRCQAIEGNTWKDYDCSTLKYFMCEPVLGNITNYTLVEINKTWCQAREYCRNKGSDLVSISNDVQNDQVIEKGNNRSFWIGLMHDEWEWEDKGCSSFRKWNNQDEGCCTIHPMLNPNPVMQKQVCANGESIFCSRGHVRIKVIPIESTWEQAFDYCKAKHTRLLWIESVEDQNAVVQWLNYTQGGDRRFWIGLRQSRVFGFWIWASDRMVGYSNWKNKTQPELPLSNHCGVITPSDNYTWSDENCLFPLHFLCEEEIYFMNN